MLHMHSVQSSFKSPCGHPLHEELVVDIDLHDVQALLLAAVPQHLTACTVMATTTASLLDAMVRNYTEVEQCLTLCYSDESDDLVMKDRRQGDFLLEKGVLSESPLPPVLHRLPPQCSSQAYSCDESQPS